jgi:hypothetical protein
MSNSLIKLCPTGVKVKACHNSANTIVQAIKLFVPKIIEVIVNPTTANNVYHRKVNSFVLLLKGLLSGACGA